MTLPSDVLDAVAAGLKQVINQPAPAPQVPVLVIDDTTLADVTEYHTLPAPSVLLTGVGFTNEATHEGLVELSFLARCLSRVARKEGEVIFSRGDIALNLAALVYAALDANTPWLDDDNAPIAYSRPTRIQARNLGARTLAARGMSMWAVSWQQQFQIAPNVQTAVLHAFKRFHFTLAMGTEDTPDISGALELQGATPP